MEGPALAAFYWTGGVPNPCRVSNISRKGAYIETDKDWYKGTVLHLVLECQPAPQPARDSTKPFGLWARIVRADPRGMGMEFIMTDRQEEAEFKQFLETAIGGMNQRKESPPS